MNVIEVSVFCNYKVKHICNYSYINEDGDFFNDKIEEEFEISGNELLVLISKSIKENNVIDVIFNNKEIYIEKFNPLTGETDEHKYILNVQGVEL